MRNDLTHVFLVTDSDEAFQEMAQQITAGKSCRRSRISKHGDEKAIQTMERQINIPQVIQLYRDYLENFVINKGEGA
jgi:hypothetical protein